MPSLSNAQSDRESLKYKPEASFGNVATGNYYGLRFNTEALKYNLTTAKSNEIVDRRTVKDLIPVDADGEGPVGAELSYGEYEWLIQSALACAAPTNVVGVNGVGTGTATFSSTGVNVATGTPFANVESGQWVGVVGAATSGNNKLVQALTVVGAGTGITVASGVFAAETGTTGVVFRGARYKNGSAKPTCSIERQNADLGTGNSGFEMFRGMAVNKWTQDYKAGSIITQSFEFMGKDSLPMSTGTSFTGGTGIASQTNKILNAVNNISNITEGGVLLTAGGGAYMKSMQFALNNNISGIDALENLGNVDLNWGEFNVQLKCGIYLNGPTYYNKFRNGTESSMSYRLTDPAGNAYVFTLPRAVYSQGERPNPGRNQSVMLNVTIDALEDPVTGQALIIDRCGAAVVMPN